MSKAFDPDLGGRGFTERLVQHFKQDFSKRYKLNSLDKPRPTLRLLNECHKLKQRLSANMTSIPINIDCLAEDKDVSGHIDRYRERPRLFPCAVYYFLHRVEFNGLCKDLLMRVRAPLEDALAKSGTISSGY